VAHQPEARQPAAPRRTQLSPVAPQAPTRAIQPGDLICGQCGEGNGPERKFCRRCGNSLAEAVVAPTPKTKWWQRFWRRPDSTVRAGQRPTSRPGAAGAAAGRATKRVLIVLVVVALALIAIPRFGPVVNPVHKWVMKEKTTLRKKLKPKYVEVHPNRASATSEDPAHPAALAIDGKSNTFWAVNVKAPNGGVGQSITISFDKPLSVSQLGFTTGAQDKSENFLTQPRPSTVHLTMSNASGAAAGSKSITLADSSKFQTFSVSGKNVTKIQIQITGIYQSSQGGGHQVSLTEVEFFKTT
jgi:hypothetical protein